MRDERKVEMELPKIKIGYIVNGGGALQINDPLQVLLTTFCNKPSRHGVRMG